MNKTKVLRNKHVDQKQVIVEGNIIEETESYIYLGQKVSLIETNIEAKSTDESKWDGRHSMTIRVSSKVVSRLV